MGRAVVALALQRGGGLCMELQAAFESLGVILRHLRKGALVAFQVAVAQKKRVPLGRRHKGLLHGDPAVEPCLAVGQQLPQLVLLGRIGVHGLRQRRELQPLVQYVHTAGAVFEGIVPAAHGVFDVPFEGSHRGVGRVRLRASGHQFHLGGKTLALPPHQLQRLGVGAQLGEIVGAGG